MTKKHMLKVWKYLVYFTKELLLLPKIIKETKYTQTPVTFKIWFMQRVIGINRKVYWPTHFTSEVGNPENVYAGIDTSPGYSPGCYIQAIGETYIGDYTQIGPNVGIISSNHNINDTRDHILGKVKIGKYCWIGMNSVILPDVELGDFTIVAAGSVVTKSFVKGYCVIAGNPAVVKKELNKKECKKFKNKYEYNGYIKSSIFKNYQKEFNILDKKE
jgi:acetyltransferase-like isoleucine patch superfamily enzyme